MFEYRIYVSSRAIPRVKFHTGVCQFQTQQLAAAAAGKSGEVPHQQQPESGTRQATGCTDKR